MSKTIHDRLYDLHLAETKWLRIDNALIPATAAEADAAMNAVNAMDENIATPWNAAVEAMKTATLTCPYCSGEIGGMQPRQMPHGGCSHCAPLYAAIAQMEGNSHSRDEAMVEDKRYERDDIYKK